MYKNIANFLKESPEWIENWLNTPVKAKYIQNPLMIPEVMANVLNYLPLRYCKRFVNFGIEKSILHYMTFIESKNYWLRSIGILL